MDIAREVFKSGAIISLAVLVILLFAFTLAVVGPEFILVPEDSVRASVAVDPNCELKSQDSKGGQVAVRPNCALESLSRSAAVPLANFVSDAMRRLESLSESKKMVKFVTETESESLSNFLSEFVSDPTPDSLDRFAYLSESEIQTQFDAEEISATEFETLSDAVRNYRSLPDLEALSNSLYLMSKFLPLPESELEALNESELEPARKAVVNAVGEDLTVHNSWTTNMWRITGVTIAMIAGFAILLLLITVVLPRLKSIGSYRFKPSPQGVKRT